MFSSAIVIFREIIEIALILGIVLAATRGLQNRMKWIALGFGGGFAGAGLVAIFAGAISEAASGMGQELFNAGILFTAALVIGWTVLWMRAHAREISAHFRQVSHDVRDGKAPFYTLSIIIGLAILREGSEIVLFIYGMSLSGQSTSSIITGSTIGFIGGVIVGALFYYGLLRVSAKYMLTVTSWMLMILVAGLASQGIGYLTAAGYFSNFSNQVWDSSRLLSESSLFGKALHSLIGYTSHPTAIQLVIYISVLISLIFGSLMIEKRKSIAKSFAVAALLILIISQPAYSLDKIYTPYVQKGEAEIEYSGNRSFDHDKEKDNNTGHEIELAYGLTDYWQVEVAGGFERGPGEPLKMQEIELENIFQFTQPGEMMIDSGLLVSYIHALHKGEPDAVEAKLLLAKDTGKFSHIANIGLEQGIGGNNSGGPEASLLWNSRYRLYESFQPGIELQSNFGQTNTHDSFQDQEHFVGPAAMGKVGPFKYEAAYLFGITDASPNSAARVLIEYEHQF